MRVKLFAAAGAVIALSSACAQTASQSRATSAILPRDGATEVAFENHLPEGFNITGVRLTLDGDALNENANAISIAPDTTQAIFHAKVPEGAHTVRVVAEVRVPCGLTAEPYEKLTLSISRSFTVGATGGLVHVDAFAESPWLNPAERVHLLVSLRGLSEGRVLFGQTKEAKQACGRLGTLERSRCIVQRLTDRARAQHDVAGLLCEKDKLEAMDDAIASLDSAAATTEASPTRLEATSAPKPPSIYDVEQQLAQLERDAEYCVPEDPAQIGKQEVTTDRSACARYDEPLSLRR